MTKTEKEKMIAGELYFSEDPELVADRKFAREQMTLINQAESADIRKALLKETFGTTGERLYMEPQISFDYGYNIHVGENFYANFNSIFLDVAPITIGNHCMFGPNVQLYTATHPLHPVKRNSGLESGKSITLGNNVWLGGNVVITPGVTLGDNVVVGAGAVVTKSFPANVVIAGNPACVIKEIEMDNPTDSLVQQREKIDAIDRQLIQLLEERMTAVSGVVAYKKETGKAVLDSSREASILEKVADNIRNPLYTTTISQTFEAIMRYSRDFQQEQLKGD